jgi:iron complex transport system substrate-binding protein
VPALSAERLDLIDVDLILWDGVRENLEASGLFDLATYRNLDAVRQDRQVFPSSTVADALSFKSVLSLPWALERLEGQIATAVTG